MNEKIDYLTDVSKPVILLTASIDPRGMPFTRRADPKTREADYIWVMHKVINNTDLPVIFCENSGYPLDKIKSEFSGINQNRLEFVQYTYTGDFSKGKGLGEMSILKYALANSTLIKNASHIIKLTGRYYIENISKLINTLSNDLAVDVITNFSISNPYTFSGLFVGSKKFIYKYLIPLEDEIDDNKKQPFEKALHKAVVNAASSGLITKTFDEQPKVLGISGTWNVKIKKDNPNAIVFSFPKIKRYVQIYSKILLQRLEKFFLLTDDK